MVLMAFENRFGHRLRKRRGKMLAIFIFQNLCPVFGHDTTYIDIKHLAAVKADFPVLTGRQGRAIYCQYFDVIGVIHLSQGSAHTSGLAAGLVVTVFRLFVALTIRARRRWLTVIAAIEG